MKIQTFNGGRGNSQSNGESVLGILVGCNGDSSICLSDCYLSGAIFMTLQMNKGFLVILKCKWTQ